MFDLQAGIHLQKIVFVVFGVEEELDRSGVDIADRFGCRHCNLAHLGAHGLADGHTWGLFDQLLVAALDAALPFAEADGVAVAVCKNLYLDVAGVGDQLLQVDCIAAEGSHGLAAGCADGAGQGADLLDGTHSFAAAAGRRFDHQRKADRLCCGDQIFVVQPLVGARDKRHPTLAHRLPRRDFVAHRLDGFRARANEGDPGIPTGCRKFGSF